MEGQKAFWGPGGGSVVHPTGKTHRAAAGDVGIPSARNRSPLLAERAAASRMAYLPGGLAASISHIFILKSSSAPDFELIWSISAAVSPVPLLFDDLRRSLTDPFSHFCLTGLCTNCPVDNQFLKPGLAGATCPYPWSLFSFLGLCSPLLSAQPPPGLSSSGSYHFCSKLQILSRHLSYNTLILTLFTPL